MTTETYLKLVHMIETEIMKFGDDMLLYVQVLEERTDGTLITREEGESSANVSITKQLFKSLIKDAAERIVHNMLGENHAS